MHTTHKDKLGTTIKEFDILYLENFNPDLSYKDECRIVLYRDNEFIIKSLSDDSYCSLYMINECFTLILNDSRDSFITLKNNIVNEYNF